jgi:hypothetical protein
MAKSSADKASALSAGIQPGPMDETIAGCAQANAVYPHAAEYPDPDHMTKYATALGDGRARRSLYVTTAARATTVTFRRAA